MAATTCMKRLGIWVFVATLSTLVALFVFTAAPTRQAVDRSLIASSAEHGRLAAHALLEAPVAPLFAAASSVRVHVPVAAPLGGYFQLRTRRARSAGSINVTALALCQQRTRVVVTGFDAVTMSAVLREQIRQVVPATLVTTATHTHSGPGGFGSGWLDGMFLGAPDGELQDALAAAHIAASRRAVEACAPAQLAHGQIDASDLVVNRSARGEPLDGTLDVVALLSERGVSGRLVAFSAHPTLVSSRDLLDGDYAAALRQALATREGQIPTLFAAGPTGSASARRLSPDDPAGRLGAELALRIDEQVGLIAEPRDIALGHRRDQITMPVPRVPLGRHRVLAGWLSAHLVPRSLPVDVILAGAVVIAVLPGELSAEITGELRQRYIERGRRLVLASHNGAYGGYFMPADRYLGAGPEAALELYGAGSSELFGAYLTGLLHGLSAPPDSSKVSGRDNIDRALE